MKISVVVPIYNEQEVLPELPTRLGAVLDGIDGEHEVILVDDGSRDGSVAIIEEAAATDPRLVLVQVARNFGHQAALSAGMDEVRGDVTVFMDADLQPLDAGDFSLMSLAVVNTIRSSREHNRYLRGLRTWVGFKQVGIEVERAARAAGESKYNLSRLFKLGFDGLFAFSALPVRIASLIGAGSIGGSLLYVLYAIVVKVRGGSPDGFTALVAIIVFLAGVQLLVLGVLGEYIHRILDEVRNRPLYVVRRRIGRDD